MKSFLAVAVMALLSTSALALSDFSTKKVFEAQNMIKKYGSHTQLKNLHNPMRQQRNGPPQQGGDGATGSGNVKNIGGVLIDVTSPGALPLGVAVGSQSNPDIKGKCYYATVSTIALSNEWQWAIQDIPKTFQWYQALVINTIHLGGNFAAVYETCNYGQLLDTLAAIIGFDAPVVAEIVARNGVAAVTVIPEYLSQLKTYTQGDFKDYYQAGIILAKLLQLAGWSVLQ